MMSMPYDQPKIKTVGDCGLMVEYGTKIDPQINGKVLSARFALEQEKMTGIIEIVPAYCSLLIVYDPLTVTMDDLVKTICYLSSSETEIELPPPETVEVPVCYGGQWGSDLERVATVNDLTMEKVVELHCAPYYPVYMLGFTPGFPFLGGLHEELFTPRLERPRTSVPAGSVGIANNQTGIYPIESPGGWQVIGRTPLKLFDPARKSPFLLKAGDYLKFKPISAEEFRHLLEE